MDMTERKFFYEVANEHFTLEVVEYAKARSEKLESARAAKDTEAENLRADLLGAITAKEEERLTAKALAQIVGVSPQKASSHLVSMFEEGLIDRERDGDRDPYRYFVE